MDMSLQTLWRLTVLTVRDPRAAAHLVRELDLGKEAGWVMIVLSAVATALILGFFQIISPVPEGPITLPNGMTIELVAISPIQQGITSFVAALALTVGITFIGQRRGGQGSFADMLPLMAMLQIIMVVVQTVQLCVALVSPVLGMILLALSFIVLFRALGHFTQVGHRFETMGQAAMTVFMTFVNLLLLVIVLSAILGG